MRAVGRRRRGVMMAAACSALAVLAACSSAGATPHPGAAAVLPAGAARALGRGTLYLLLGRQAISANLWQVDLDTGKTRQLTFNPPQYGVSNFDASPAGLVLGDARTGVDLAEIMRHGKPELLSGGIGDSPQINDAGQIADVAGADPKARHGPWSHDRLLLWDSPSGPYRTIYRARPGDLASNAWNPAGNRILLTNGPGDEAYTRLFTVNTRGQVRPLVTLPGNVGVAWGPYGLAVTYGAPDRPAEVLSQSGRVRDRLPVGWAPVCWDPGGSELLVASSSGRQIGIWRPARPGRVQHLGTLPGGQELSECSWISRPAAGT